MKGQKTDRTLYPYEEGFGDDARFAIEPKDKKKEIDVWLGNKNAEFDIKIEISDDNSIENSTIRLINEDINGIIEDLEIETYLKEKIGSVLFSNLSIKKKRIAIRKLKKYKIEEKFIKMFLNLLEYIDTV